MSDNSKTSEDLLSGELLKLPFLRQTLAAMISYASELERSLSIQTQKIETCKSALVDLRIENHRESEDCWFSCPKSETGCCDDSVPKDQCTCGKDRNNQIIDQLLKELNNE
jgi:hypothetical protein